MRSSRLPLSRLHELPVELRPGTKIFLSGPYWAGKTALVSHLLTERLGINEPVLSPTYGYYREYPGNIKHFDLTRLPDYASFAHMGFEEYFDDSDAIVLVEWPEILSGKIVPDLLIQIELVDNDLREYRLFDRLDDADFLDRYADSVDHLGV